MTNGSSAPNLDFRRMISSDRPDVFALLSDYFTNDPYYEASSVAYRGREATRDIIDATLAEGIALFLDRPDYGFVWLAFEEGRVVGCAAIGYAISLSLGRVVASLDLLAVAPASRRHGVGAELVESLVAELEGADIARLDAAVHERNDGARQFLSGLGFEPLHEERMSLILG
jgi:GNAT superfamily N-acetyltransferase